MNPKRGCVRPTALRFVRKSEVPKEPRSSAASQYPAELMREEKRDKLCAANGSTKLEKTSPVHVRTVTQHIAPRST